MVVVGLTGGIACGKSAVAAAMAARGVPVVDADRGAREVVAPGTEGLAAVVAAFGDDVLADDGSLDRKRLGAVVFGDAARRSALEKILHPRIAAWSAGRFADLDTEGHPFGLYEAALLVENGAWKMFDALVVVSASPDVQRARIVARDGLTEAEAQARIDAQWPLAEKRAVATWVVENDGDRAALEAQVDVLHATLVERYGRR